MTGRFWPIDDRLRHWHPVVLAGRVSVTPLAIQCCGVPIVLFRSGNWMRAIPHLARSLFCRLVSAELDRNKAIIEKMPRDQAGLDWFQLSRFDGPLVATRKLMARHYAPTRDRAPIGCDLEPAAIPPAITSDARL